MHNGYIKFKSINPENGKEYVSGDIIEQLDKEWLIKMINIAQRNTVATNHHLENCPKANTEIGKLYELCENATQNNYYLELMRQS